MKIREPRIFISIGIGLLGFFIAYGILSWRENKLISRTALVPVVVSQQPISAGQIIKANHVRIRQIPRLYVSPGSLNRLEGVIGRMAIVSLAQGEPVLGNKLTRGGTILSSKIGEGRRAFTVPADETSSLAGMVRPGDLVDVLATFDIYENSSQYTNFTATLFQAVRILAVGGEFSTDAPSRDEQKQRFLGGLSNNRIPQTVTLDVSPAEAEMLLFCLSQGRVTLSLRSPEDLEYETTTVTTFEEILKRTGLSRAKVRDLPRRPAVEIIRGTIKGR